MCCIYIFPVFVFVYDGGFVSIGISGGCLQPQMGFTCERCPVASCVRGLEVRQKALQTGHCCGVGPSCCQPRQLSYHMGRVAPYVCKATHWSVLTLIVWRWRLFVPRLEIVLAFKKRKGWRDTMLRLAILLLIGRNCSIVCSIFILLVSKFAAFKGLGMIINWPRATKREVLKDIWQHFKAARKGLRFFLFLFFVF